MPAEYRHGAANMPSSVFESDPDVLNAQNEIPETGRPVRTRPSIPNYQSRVTAEELEASFVESAEQSDTTAIDAVEVESVEPNEPAAHHGAADTLLGGAAKAGEAGAALIGNIQHSGAAAKAKDIASGIPGKFAALGKRGVAALHAEDGSLRKKPLAIMLAVLLYLVVAIHFSFHYYPMTSIGPVQVGGMDVEQAATAIGEAVDGYVLQVTGENGESFTVESSEAGLSFDSKELAQQAMDADSGFAWPIAIIMPHDHSDVMMASKAASGFREKISDAVNYYNEDAKAPVDAGIKYDEANKAFSITPEELGTMLDEEKVTEHVSEALASMQSELVLSGDDYVQPAVFQDDERLVAALAEAEKTTQTSIVFTAHNAVVDTLDGSTLPKWVRTDENVQMVLDEDQVNAWVEKLVEKSSTVGAKRTWTREDGVKCTVPAGEGEYGWQADWLAIDEEIHELVYTGVENKVEIPMQQEGAIYTGPNDRDWKSYIDVDLDAQHATYYDDNGKVLWQADFVSGTPDGEHDTPQGVYYINNKESPATLVGDRNEYRTKVQYWMAWRGNDIGFHDADWQPDFGGSLYMEGNGSHGCINLSPEDAASLYEVAPVDTVVVCHGASGQKAEKAEKSEGSEEASEDGQ